MSDIANSPAPEAAPAANRDPVPTFRFDTRALPAGYEFAIWRTIFDEFYDIVPTSSDQPRPFSASMTTWNLAGVLVSRGEFTAQRFVRTTRRARRDGFDPYTVLLHRKGHWRADTGQREIGSAPGRVCMLDFARPHSSDVTLNDSVSVTLPREFLDSVLPPRDVHGLMLGGARGGLLHDFMISLANRLPDAAASDAPLLGAAFRDMLAVCLLPSPETAERARPQLDMLAYQRARALIDANLHHPDWGAEDLRVALAVSRATLYRVFARFGGVAEHIRSLRLARAHALLTASRGRQRISEIARMCGFTSEAHFSRAFRQIYGYTATDATANGRPGPGMHQDRVAHMVEAPDVLEWIRRLRA